MYPGSLQLILNGSVPAHAGVQCTQVFNLACSTVYVCM